MGLEDPLVSPAWEKLNDKLPFSNEWVLKGVKCDTEISKGKGPDSSRSKIS